jgi:sortase A
MKRTLSGILIGLGILMILGAAGLLLYNRQESERMASFSARVLPGISEYQEAALETATAPPLEKDPLAPPQEMPVAEIDGYSYVGVLSIPTIDYEIPVLAETGLALLKLGACRFYGSTYENNLVLCAHNYERLFSRLTELKTGDTVWFTDMDGLTWSYEVADLEILEADMVEEMTDSGYDLTFFTCTYGGQARLTLRCVRS